MSLLPGIATTASIRMAMRSRVGRRGRGGWCAELPPTIRSGRYLQALTKCSGLHCRLQWWGRDSHRGSTRMVVVRAAGLLMRSIADVEPRYLHAYSASTAGSISGCSVASRSTQVTSRTIPRAFTRPWCRDRVDRNQAASGPFTDRRYSSSPTRTIHTIRSRESEPSRRTELTSTCPAPPNRLRSSGDQIFAVVFTSFSQRGFGSPAGVSAVPRPGSATLSLIHAPHRVSRAGRPGLSNI
jgi:hypothetical protein